MIPPLVKLYLPNSLRIRNLHRGPRVKNAPSDPIEMITNLIGPASVSRRHLTALSDVKMQNWLQLIQVMIPTIKASPIQSLTLTNFL